MAHKVGIALSGGERRTADTSGTSSGMAVITAHTRSADRHRALQSAGRLEQAVAERLGHWLHIRPGALAHICRSVAAMDSDLDRAIQVEFALFIALIFALDDRLDAPAIPGARKAEWLRQCMTVFNGGEPAFEVVEDPSWRQILFLLRHHCEAIRSSTGAAGGIRHYLRQLRALVRAWARETHWRREYIATGILPSSGEYLRNGRVSVAMPVGLTALLLMTGQAPSSPDDRTWQLVNQVELLCGTIVRLANDCGNLLRELQEQKPNNVLIAMAEQGITLYAARCQLRERAAGYLARLPDRIACLPPYYRAWGRMAHRLTVYWHDFFLLHEGYTHPFHQGVTIATGIQPHRERPVR